MEEIFLWRKSIRRDCIDYTRLDGRENAPGERQQKVAPCQQAKLAVDDFLMMTKFFFFFFQNKFWQQTLISSWIYVSPTQNLLEQTWSQTCWYVIDLRPTQANAVLQRLVFVCDVKWILDFLFDDFLMNFTVQHYERRVVVRWLNRSSFVVVVPNCTWTSYKNLPRSKMRERVETTFDDNLPSFSQLLSRLKLETLIH